MFKIFLNAIQVQCLSIKGNLRCRHQLFILAAQLRLLLHQRDIRLAKRLFLKLFSRKKLLSVLILKLRAVRAVHQCLVHGKKLRHNCRICALIVLVFLLIKSIRRIQRMPNMQD